MATNHNQQLLLSWLRAIGALLWPIIAAAGLCSLFAALAALAGTGIYGALTAQTNVILVVVVRLTAVGALTGLIVGICFSIDRAMDRIGTRAIGKGRWSATRTSKTIALNGTPRDSESPREDGSAVRPEEKNHRNITPIRRKRS